MMSATTFSTEISSVEVLAVKVGAIEVFPTETTLVESFTCINATTHANLPETLKKFCLLEKVVVITGGARGLGKNMAEAMCQVGCKAVALLDVRKEEGDNTALKLAEKYGINVKFYQIDVTNDEKVAKIMLTINEELGGLDVLLCSAGIADSNMPAETYDTDRFRNLININLTGLFLCTRAAGAIMIQKFKNSANILDADGNPHANGKPKGSIIFIASMSGRIVNWPQEQCAYNASKAGVKHLATSLAAEWSKYNIRVNSISPGYMDTVLNSPSELDALKKLWKERTPMERLGNEDELNNLAVYLASDASTFMTGSDLVIDGGYCCW